MAPRAPYAQRRNRPWRSEAHQAGGRVQGEALVPCCQGLVGRLYGFAARGGEGQERLAVEGPEGGGLVALVEMVSAEAPRDAPYGTAQDFLHGHLAQPRSSRNPRA